MSLVLLADAQARSGESVTQAMIDEEEAWLATQVGPLTGARTETFYLPARLAGTIDGLYLSRRTAAVTSFTSDGVALTQYRVADGYVIERNSDATESWSDPLVVTYTPNDTEIVKGVIYDLLVYRSLPTNLQSVRIGAYSETYATGSAVDPVKASLVGQISTHAGLGAYAEPFRFSRSKRDRTKVTAT